MIMNCLVLFSLTLLSTSIRVMLLNSKTSSKNMAIVRLLNLVDFVFIVTIFFKPMKFGTVVIDSLLMGLYCSLAFKMNGFCQNIRNLNSELESKAKDVNSAEAKTISMRKQSEELVLERDRLLESSGNSLKQLESELETKTRDISIAKANNTALKKQLDQLLLEYDVLLERNQILKNQSESLNTRVKELESELETRTKDVKVAEANHITLRKQFEKSLLENDRLSESNQVLNNQLQSSGTRLQQLKFELETKRNEANAVEAKIVAIRKEKQDLNIQLQSASTSLRRKEYELETRTKNVTTAEAKNLDLRRQLEFAKAIANSSEKEIQSLKNQLQSSEIKLKQVGYEATTALSKENQSLKSQLQLSSTRLEQLESAEATVSALTKKIQSLKNELQTSETKLKQVGSAEATTTAQSKENQSLKNQLQSSSTKLKQLESAKADADALRKALEKKLAQVKSAEATLREENQSLKNRLLSSGSKSVKETKAGTSATEKFGRFLFDQF